MTRARRLRTPEADSPVRRAISVESKPATYRRARILRSSGLQVGQGPLEIDQSDGVRRIATLVGLQRVGDVDHRPPPLGSDQLARLVGGDGDQPGTHLFGVAQGSQATPGDRPRSLHGVTGRLRIAADDECHAGHGGAVLRNEAREGGLVTPGGETDDGGDSRCVVHSDVRHER